MLSKIQQSELNNQNQANQISLKDWVVTTMNNRVVNTQPRNTIIPKTVQWDSDWITATEVDTDKLSVAWTISIGQFNYNWINNFSVEIITRGLGTGYKVERGIEFSKSIWWDIKDLVGKETADTKDIKLLASVYNYVADTPIFEAKLLVRYYSKNLQD